MKHELQNILAGKSQVEHGANIQAIASYLKDSKRTGTLAAKGNQFKKTRREVHKTVLRFGKELFFHLLQIYLLIGVQPKRGFDN